MTTTTIHLTAAGHHVALCETHAQPCPVTSHYVGTHTLALDQSGAGQPCTVCHAQREARADADSRHLRADLREAVDSLRTGDRTYWYERGWTDQRIDDATCR